MHPKPVSTLTQSNGFSKFSANVLTDTAHLAQKNAHSLASLWARKYIHSLSSQDFMNQQRSSEDLQFLLSSEGRHYTTAKLKKYLTQASALAWSTTEMLLAEEIQRHNINPNLINPWQIAADSHNLFYKALDAYANSETPQRLSVLVGKELGQVRQKYTAVDPRVIGFVSMQFHYTGRKLLERLSPLERSLLTSYFKVMDDHMYMPLQKAYEAASQHPLDSPVLVAVQHLLPVSTAIALSICNQLSQLYPAYQTYSGFLNSTTVRVSSIRDAEMFQVYLCLCVLQDDISAVQQELFPLCIMLYPKLQVRWSLVQDLLQHLKWEIHDRLEKSDATAFLPYLHTLMDMFSPEVLGNLINVSSTKG
jgi:hypothetical protein